MPVTYLIEFDVRPAQRERFLELLGGVLTAMSAEPNYRDAVLHVQSDDPSKLMLYETWADHQDVLDVQLLRPYRAAWHEALPDLLERPRRIQVWSPLPRYDGREGGRRAGD